MLDMYLLGQWGAADSTGEDSTEEEGRNAEADNGQVITKARDEWMVNALVGLGVCAELRGGGLYFFSTPIADTSD